MSTSKEVILTQGAREISRDDVQLIQQTVKRFPKLPKTEIIATICEHLNWLSPAGLPKIQACEALLYQMQEQGLVRIKPKGTRQPLNRPSPIITPETDAPTKNPDISLKNITPVDVFPVTGEKEKQLWNEYIERYHPLQYKHPFGYNIRYLIHANDQYLGCILLSGASRALALRDRWIGWQVNQRKANLSWVVNNSRYLIFPWVNIPHLASHVLGQLAHRVAGDWEERWGFAPLLLETFVDPRYYSGICYQAAGWELLGKTTGRGLAQPGKTYTSSPKLIYVKPLSKHYQSLLCSTLQGRKEL